MKSYLRYFNTFRFEWLFLLILVIATSIPRIYDLGFSHFYGDETKVLYLDKTVSAKDYFLNQRKGPVQFLVAWGTEKITGGYDEFWTRLPFSAAGVLATVILYFLVRELFGINTAILSSLLFGFNGFFVAFARTVQYQSFLFLFGFTALYFVILYKRFSKPILLLIAGFLYGLAFLTHYDAIFFIVPALFLLDYKKLTKVTYFFISIAVVVLPFYVPYFYRGYFESNTQGYLYRRLTGQSQELPNNSFYTNSIYNPNILYSILLASGLFIGCYYLIKQSKLSGNLSLISWFVVPFLVFTVVFENPGTHIINFIIPAIIIASFGLNTLYEKTKLKSLVFVLVLIVLCSQVILSYAIFIPKLNLGYPWKNSHLAVIQLEQAQKESQLFLYGFPYNRNWIAISQELHRLGARGYYTNDNLVTAEYYVGSLPITRAGTNFLPQYYIDVVANQELQNTDAALLSNYSLITEIHSPYQTPSAFIYKIKSSADN